MLDEIGAIRQRFGGCQTLDDCVDEALAAVHQFGFHRLVYDYTPVTLDIDGTLMLPSLLMLRNVDEDMRLYWFDQGYYRIDPTQRLAAQTSTPFFWDLDRKSETDIRAFLVDDAEPAVRYLRDRDQTTGVTVPIHMPGGGYATVTAICNAGDLELGRDAGSIARLGLIAHIFHENAYAKFDATAHKVRVASLSRRERECLRLCAEGYSAKQIARVIGRSEPTVVMHLSAAAKKLGARNRTQAVVRALHYRLIDL
ncbi:LuxR family transcriptional regulator [Aquamicrobium terrae]|uniref:LuxR family transcriptional regulator n=1 Tax=Aquamicrobium terrae TaxID=1324945 RepID=A0ABV2N5M6_9HYPH